MVNINPNGDWQNYIEYLLRTVKVLNFIEYTKILDFYSLLIFNFNAHYELKNNHFRSFPNNVF